MARSLRLTTDLNAMKDSLQVTVEMTREQLKSFDYRRQYRRKYERALGKKVIATLREKA